MSTICRCSVFGCTRNSRNSEVSFFRFPKDVDRARLWVTACKRLDLLGKLDKLHNSSYRVCGAHFRREMFASDLRNRLQRLAVPSVFNIVAKKPTNTTKPVFTGATIYIVQAPNNQGDTSQTLQQQSLPGLITYPKPIITNQRAAVEEIVVDPLQDDGMGGVELVEEPSCPILEEALTFVKEEHDLEEEISFPLPPPPPLQFGQEVNPLEEGEIPNDVEETEVSFIVKEEPQSPNALEMPMPAFISMQMPKETRDLQVQTTSDLIMQIPRIVKLKRTLKYLENENFFLKQKVKKLQNPNEDDKFLERVTFEDYKQLTYVFCPSKSIADTVIENIVQARQVASSTMHCPE